MLCGVDSDEQLMQAYQQGDHAAFDALYDRYRGDVYRFLLRQFDTAIAEEIYQEVWIKVINAREGYAATARFRTWLYTIVHNHLRDHWRRQQARLSEVQSDEARNTEPVDHINPETVTNDQQAVAALHEGIKLLPLEQRQAFLLKAGSGLSVQEIAEVTGSSKESTKSRLRYAMSKLRQHLEGIWP